MKKPPGRAAGPMEIEMGDAPLMLGVSGLRGIVGESLTPEVATRYAAAFGSWLRQRTERDPTVLVGADGRKGWEVFSGAARDGLLASDCYVKECGVVMTPTAGILVDQFTFDGAIVVTASHNPQEWNGLKLLVRESNLISSVRGDGDKDPVSGRSYQDTSAPQLADATNIVERFHNVSKYQANALQKGRTLQSLDIKNPVADHVGLVLQLILGDMRTTGLEWHQNIDNYKVVVDSVNASGSAFADALIGNLGADYVQLHGDDSGNFPHTPEPTEENLSGEGGLCDAVPGLKADVGFAQDPDGDRLAIVDEKGGYIGEEYTLVLCAVSVLEAMNNQTPSDRSAATSPVGDGGGEGAPHPGSLPLGEREKEVVLCANLSTSRMIDDVAARYGASVVRTAVGEANVVEAMKRLKKEGKNVVLGGEGNGGVIWPKVTYVRDSLSSMALVLSLMARTGKTVSELVADVPSYSIVKRKQPLAKKEDARPAIERLAAHYTSERVDTQDGVRVDFDSDRSWVHVRASNTEPILRLIAEAPTKERAEAVLDEVQGLVDAG